MAKCKECFHYQACKGTYYEVKEYGEFDGEMYAECGCDDFLPVANVEEVKHGEWKVEFHNGKKFITCSACGSVIDCYATYIDENEYDGCPYCRAIMDGGK